MTYIRSLQVCVVMPEVMVQHHNKLLNHTDHFRACNGVQADELLRGNSQRNCDIKLVLNIIALLHYNL